MKVRLDERLRTFLRLRNLAQYGRMGHWFSASLRGDNFRFWSGVLYLAARGAPLLLLRCLEVEAANIESLCGGPGVEAGCVDDAKGQKTDGQAMKKKRSCERGWPLADIHALAKERNRAGRPHEQIYSLRGASCLTPLYP